MINISPSNIFQKMLLLEKYYQNCQACFGRSRCEWVKAQAEDNYAGGNHFSLNCQSTQACSWTEIIKQMVCVFLIVVTAHIPQVTDRLNHGLSQQGVWVPFWTPKPLKRTPQDTQIFQCGISRKSQSQAYD